jgi:glycosyltransferase involved in cell wall biosynthesis
MPFFSIITINLNNKIGLTSTIESVVNQNYKDFEFLIIDGKSNDGSVDVINDNLNNINFYISEKDLGIYDAMNKGIKYSNGNFLVFMNSGDIFYNEDVLKNVYTYLIKNDCFILYGDHAVNDNNIIYNSKAKKIKNIYKGSIASHQSMFFNRKIFNKKIYNTYYKYAADYDLFYFIYNNHFRELHYLDIIISTISKNGLSESNSIATYSQFFNISKKYSKNKLFIYLFFYYKLTERKLIFLLKKIINA